MARGGALLVAACVLLSGVDAWGRKAEPEAEVKANANTSTPEAEPAAAHFNTYWRVG
jgi:hypothetical protein